MIGRRKPKPPCGWYRSLWGHLIELTCELPAGHDGLHTGAVDPGGRRFAMTDAQAGGYDCFGRRITPRPRRGGIA